MCHRLPDTETGPKPSIPKALYPSGTGIIGAARIGVKILVAQARAIRETQLLAEADARPCVPWSATTQLTGWLVRKPRILRMPRPVVVCAIRQQYDTHDGNGCVTEQGRAGEGRRNRGSMAIAKGEGGPLSMGTGWYDHVPSFLRRVLVVGCGDGEDAYRLKTRLGIEVYGVEPDDASRALAETRLDGVAPGNGLDAPLPFPREYFDGVLISPPGAREERLGQLLVALTPLLHSLGFLMISREIGPSWTEPEIEESIADSGWVLYGAAPRLLVAIKPGYNPILHGRRLLDAGLPKLSFDALKFVPPAYHKNPETRATIASEMLFSLLAWDASANDGERLARFTTAMGVFQMAVSQVPEMPEPCQCMAELWRRLGDSEMAMRMLRSLHHVAPSESVARQLDTLSADPVDPRASYCPPEWHEPPQPPRILFVSHELMDYGLDVLYDGLCTVLGEGNVVDFPWKPTLHGDVMQDLAHYPSSFNRSGVRHSLEEICAMLERGRFDWILFGHTARRLEREMIRRLLASAGQTPCVIVDAGDDCGDNRHAIAKDLGMKSVAAYLKREMLTCAEYAPNTFPMPFAYADNRVPADASGERPVGLFWAGHRNFSLRRLYLMRLEELLGEDYSALYEPDQYSKALTASQIGLNLFGGGFDTVRYWELPAHGCMLLSERPPIHIPHNFRDGESAVFFDDLPELEDKLTYYLAHPDETRAIAMAGHEHFKRHHTASARARHLLGWVQQILEA